MTMKQKMILWNLKFPLDLWWRKKHSVAFLSKKHLEISQIQIYLEYLEDSLLKKDSSKYKRGDDILKISSFDVDDLTLENITFDEDGNIKL